MSRKEFSVIKRNNNRYYLAARFGRHSHISRHSWSSESAAGEFMSANSIFPVRLWDGEKFR
jgi:hypothetical protein